MNCDFCGELIKEYSIWFKSRDKACKECNEWLEEQEDQKDQRNGRALNCDWEYDQWKDDMLVKDN